MSDATKWRAPHTKTMDERFLKPPQHIRGAEVSESPVQLYKRKPKAGVGVPILGWEPAVHAGSFSWRA